jgi:hypothetical protein
LRGFIAEAYAVGQQRHLRPTRFGVPT